MDHIDRPLKWLLVLNVLDLVFTVLFISMSSPVMEINPLMASLMRTDMGLFAGCKLSLTFLSVWMLSWARSSSKAYWSTIVLVCLYSILVAYEVVNIIDLILS